MPAVIETCAAPIGADEFAALMARLGPFGAPPRLAAAVSGGADSMALALLAARWARSRGGSVLALVVDHRLRPASRQEAEQALHRLAERGIAGRLLTLGNSTLPPGPALAERARLARYAALVFACRASGIAHLLVGHHAADQAETVLMRRLSGSGAAGLAGMAAITESDDVRLLRPLLAVAPARLRATLGTENMAWVEDPSNRDPASLRAQLRAELSEAGCATTAMKDLLAESRRQGQARSERDRAVAAILAERAAIFSEGFAALSPGPIPAAALSALLQCISGSAYPPSPLATARLAANPGPATLGGVRMLAAGRLGPGLLVVREEAAQSPPVPARSGACWDGRFQLAGHASPSEGHLIGALGAAAAAGLHRRTALPTVVLRTLPAIWWADSLVAVPHLGHPDPATCLRFTLGFRPRRPAAGAPWLAPVRNPSD